MELMNAKGVRDFAPDKKIARQRIVDTLREAFELYGFSPLETPVLERFDVLSSKYAGGAEILKEMFRLKDQGKRQLALRYDLTVPLCRFVGMNPQIKMPFKRYQIGRVFRDGPLKVGRYREFWQCDVDIVGCPDVTAEAEVLDLATRVFKSLGLKVVIKVNNRKLLNGIIDASGIKKDREGAILTLDKLEKLGQAAVEKELMEKGVASASIKALMKALKAKSLAEIGELGGEGSEGADELKRLFSKLKTYGAKAELDVSLARGLAYYTGTVYEVFLRNSDVRSSIAAGGRYDRMIGEFLGSQGYPAVGLSFGLDILSDVMDKDERKSVTDVYIIPIQTYKESVKIASQLREAGVKADLDMMGRGISKNLKYADALGIPYVVFIGEDEIKKGKLKLRDMKSGEERFLTVEGLIKLKA
ncbi:MAG: histidine--tRNA ligase [archaeon]